MATTTREEDPSSSDDVAFTTRIEELFERGYNVDKVLTELDLKGNLSSERKVLELFRDRQKKKQDRTKRFASNTTTDDVGTQSATTKHDDKRVKQSGAGHMTWVLERDASVVDRLNAPLPVPRERPVGKIPVQNESDSSQNVYPSAQSYGRGGRGGFNPQFHPGHFQRGRGRGSRGYRGGNAPWRGGNRGRQQLPFSMGVQWDGPDVEGGGNETQLAEGSEDVDHSGGVVQQHQESEGEKQSYDEQPQEHQLSGEQYPASRGGFHQPQYYPRRGGPPPYSHRPRGAAWRGDRGAHHFQPRGGGYRQPHWSGSGQHQPYGNQRWTAQDEVHQPDQVGEGADAGET